MNSSRPRLDKKRLSWRLAKVEELPFSGFWLLDLLLLLALLLLPLSLCDCDGSCDFDKNKMKVHTNSVRIARDKAKVVVYFKDMCVCVEKEVDGRGLRE